MIIQIGTEVDESRILWKHKETDEWQRADIDELIDAYESIVRCKDCRYWKNFNNVQGICHERPNIITTEQYDDFCSHGEKRKEETVPIIEVELNEEAWAYMKGGNE